jgi:hypothetical protein
MSSAVSLPESRGGRCRGWTQFAIHLLEQVAQLLGNLLWGVTGKGDGDQALGFAELATLYRQRGRAAVEDGARGLSAQIRRYPLRRTSSAFERFPEVGLCLFGIPTTTGLERQIGQFHRARMVVTIHIHSVSIHVWSALNLTMPGFRGSIAGTSVL